MALLCAILTGMLVVAALVLEPVIWTLALGGDLMLNGIEPTARPLAAIAPQFRRADLSYANLETPLTNATAATPYKSAEELKMKSQFVLSASPRHIKNLTGAGFDLLSLGNNHAMDRGASGLADTIDALRSSGIDYAGAGPNLIQADKLAVRRVRGVKVGLLSYLAFVGSGALEKCNPAWPGRAGIAVLNFGGAIDERARGRIMRRVKQARMKCDVLLVALHWGTELKSKPTAYQMALGRAWIDAGADVVLGSHPHVLQPVERRNGKPIFYSLGNLVSPKPGVTAVYTLTFAGSTLRSIRRTSCAIRGGRVYPVGVTGSKRSTRATKAVQLSLPPSASAEVTSRQQASAG